MLDVDLKVMENIKYKLVAIKCKFQFTAITQGR